jgi:hypothetical protein
MLMGAGGLSSENGEGVELGAGAGAGSGAGAFEPLGAGGDGAGAVAGPDAGEGITAGDEGGPIGMPMVGAPPIVAIMSYAPGGPEGAEPQLPPMQGVG